MLFQNNEMLLELERALTLKAQIENRNVSQANRFRLSILENELLNKTQSVVFLFKITAKTAYLQYCCPLTPEQYTRLQASGYVPLLRTGKYLKVGHDSFMDVCYAYASIQFPLDTHAIGFMEAMEYVQKELEKFLEVLTDDLSV